MIITKLKDMQDILGYLEKARTVFILGCGSCAAQCQTGGEEDVAEMKRVLEQSGKEVVGTVIPDETCHISLVKTRLAEHRGEVEKADAILVMSCGAGTQAVSSLLEMPVFPACDTLFLGDTRRLGNFAEFCSICGDCVLAVTGGICPITRCPKGILHGPCGGMHGGKCETDEDQDCAWVLIWERMKKLGAENEFKRRRAPKDYSKKQKPGNRVIRKRS